MSGSSVDVIRINQCYMSTYKWHKNNGDEFCDKNHKKNEQYTTCSSCGTKYHVSCITSWLMYESYCIECQTEWNDMEGLVK